MCYSNTLCTEHADCRIVQTRLAPSQRGAHNALHRFLIACSGMVAKLINQQASNSGT